MRESINTLDEMLCKFAYQSKLKGLGNAWIYHELERQIKKAPLEQQPLLTQWLDSRWGDSKVF